MKILRTSRASQISWLSIFMSIPGDLQRSWYPGVQLGLRDLRANFRLNILGYLWIIIPPLVTTVVWLLLNQAGISTVSAETKLPYAVFLSIGTVLWALFTDAVNITREQIKHNAETLTNLTFPLEAIIVSGGFQALVSFAVRCLMIVIACVWTGFLPAWWSVGFFAVAAVVALAGLSIGVIIGPLACIYRDIGQVVSVALPVLMYTAPVVYSIPAHGVLKTVMEANPLTLPFAAARELFTGPCSWYGVASSFAVGVGALVVLCGAWACFKIVVSHVIERR